MAGNVLGAEVGRAAAGGQLISTTALNLRTGPGTRRRVLRVIPAGAHVFDHGDLRNGFRRVTYDNIRGWASDTYLKAGTPIPGEVGPVIGAGVTTTAVNHRSGPSVGDTVIRVLPRGTTVEITETVVDGFRYAYAQGVGGWIYAEYIAPEGGEHPGYGTTTTALNLRSQPSTDARVLAVIPAGSQIRWTDELSNGFRRITYDGRSGWAYNAYLAF